jgi:hypothetical protein
MLAVYLAHCLSGPTEEERQRNRKNASRWASKISLEARVLVQASWIIMSEYWPENVGRAFGLQTDFEQIKRSDIFLMAGPKISSGMLEELELVKNIGSISIVNIVGVDISEIKFSFIEPTYFNGEKACGICKTTFGLAPFRKRAFSIIKDIDERCTWFACAQCAFTEGLATFPFDDEPETDKERAAVAEGRADMAAGRMIDHTDLANELGRK